MNVYYHVFCSGDVNFSSDLSDLRHRRKFDIILIHKEHTHDSLIVCANQHILYEDLIKDIPPRSPSKVCMLTSNTLHAVF